MVRMEALVMAFADVFYILTFLFVVLALASPLMRKPKGGPPTGAGGH